MAGLPARFAAEPCHYIIFDVLEVSAVDLRNEPLVRRRRELENLLGGGAGESRLALGMQTSDAAEAQLWLESLATIGVEDIIAKRANEPYRPGRRDWRKVKHYATTEFIIGGITGSLTRPEHLILGRYSSATGELAVAGRTVPLHDQAAEQVAAWPGATCVLQCLTHLQETVRWSSEDR